jgi:hypothetical protein
MWRILQNQLGSIAFLDVDGLEESNNMSSLFRVFSSFDSNSSIQVSKPGSNESSANTLKYSAGDGALVADSIVGLNNAITQLQLKESALKPLINEWISLVIAEQTPTPEQPDEEVSTEPVEDEEVVVEAPGDETGEGDEVVVEVPEGETGEDETTPAPPQRTSADVATEINAILALLPDAIGVRDFNIIGPFVMNMIAQGQQIEQQLGPILNTPQAQLYIQGLSNEVGALIKSVPSLGAVVSMVDPTIYGKSAVVSTILNPNLSTLQRGITFSNLETINKFFYYMHPEYNR